MKIIEITLQSKFDASITHKKKAIVIQETDFIDIKNRNQIFKVGGTVISDNFVYAHFDEKDQIIGSYDADDNVVSFEVIAEGPNEASRIGSLDAAYKTAGSHFDERLIKEAHHILPALIDAARCLENVVSVLDGDGRFSDLNIPLLNNTLQKLNSPAM